MVCDTLATFIISAYMGAAGDCAALYQGQVETSISHATWTTHPYWNSDSFQLGNICYDGNVYTFVPMRYNIMDNQLAVVAPDSKLSIVPNQDKIKWFELDGNHFEREHEWFMQVVYQGCHASLLLNKTKQNYGDVDIDRRSYHQIKTIDRYYLRLADGSLHEVKGYKSLHRAVPAYRNELRQYKRKHNIGFWQSVRQESLKSCTEFLDGLMANREPKAHPEDTTYTVSVNPTAPWDSMSISMADAASVPVFQAYASGSTHRLNYSDEKQIKPGTAGIKPLNTQREYEMLKEVEVLGMRKKQSQQYSGVESFHPSLLRNVPLVMGETDVLKLALKLPGVASTGEAGSGINVRGGATEHTQILYNGNTIFNPMHMFGLFSVIDPDLVGETDLYKGGIPSQYGGRLSSVMNIKGKTPDRNNFHGSASIGLVTSRAAVEIPIVKDRMSLLLGGRATYSDWMLKLINKKNHDSDSWNEGGNTYEYRDGKAGYWDVGGTLNTLLSSNHTLLINGYYSRDRFSLTKEKKYNYSNTNLSAELRSRYGDRLSTTLIAGYDHYDYANRDSEYPTSAATLSFNLNNYFVKGNANYALHKDHQLNMGIQGQYYRIMPGSYQPWGENSYIVGRKLNTDHAVESALWMEDTWTLSPALNIVGGVRLNLFKSFKEGLETFYLRPDIRLSANYKLNDNASVKAGFNTLHQFIHKVSNTVIMSPTDIWMLSNDKVKPQSGWQATTGYYLQFGKGSYEFSAEAYYKGMKDYLTYRNAAILVMNDHLYEDVVGTSGRAYGIELQIRKFYGKLNGWLNYTYSRTELKQKNAMGQTPINQGRWFAADYDSPHNLKLVCNYKFTRRYSTSLNAEYSTGRPYTAPIGIMPSETTGDYSVPVYSDRNKLRMPDYFRLDWSFNIEPSHHLTASTHSWFTIGVYNLLGRRNAYSIYFESDRNNVRGYKLSVFGAPIPYINYNIKF